MSTNIKEMDFVMRRTLLAEVWFALYFIALQKYEILNNLY
jgi:hypothetical protein